MGELVALVRVIGMLRLDGINNDTNNLNRYRNGGDSLSGRLGRLRVVLGRF